MHSNGWSWFLALGSKNVLSGKGKGLSRAWSIWYHWWWWRDEEENFALKRLTMHTIEKGGMTWRKVKRNTFIQILSNQLEHPTNWLDHWIHVVDRWKLVGVLFTNALIDYFLSLTGYFLVRAHQKFEFWIFLID